MGRVSSSQSESDAGAAHRSHATARCREGRRPVLGMAVAAALLTATVEVRAEDVRVYVAASLTAAVTELADAYAAAGRGEVVLVTGSSGALANQIVHGAPADIFLSANSEWVDYLVENQAVASDAVSVFAGNRLVLIAPQGSELAGNNVTPDALAIVLQDRRIVIADPQLAPVGAYARQALTALGLWPAVEPRLILAADATAALAYVSRDAVDFGIVYATDAALVAVTVIAEFPATSHDPIRYFAAPVAGGDAAAADAFLDLLLGEDGQAVLEGLGFAPPPVGEAP